MVFRPGLHTVVGVDYNHAAAYAGDNHCSDHHSGGGKRLKGRPGSKTLGRLFIA
ncbi:MAG: hypothetical protein Q7J12_00145 [Syntrophales bacterium]|uniref:hypothetical protein n=1 Tax=Candidatus Wunengus sp. YC61 TaxID=3367698 RepID=UPI002718864E|nr:hypothetical protein [Syntrophales bacterium]